MSGAIIGAAIGSAAGGAFSDRFGRKTALKVADVFFLLGATIMAFSQSASLLITGNILKSPCSSFPVKP